MSTFLVKKNKGKRYYNPKSIKTSNTFLYEVGTIKKSLSKYLIPKKLFQGIL